MQFKLFATITTTVTYHDLLTAQYKYPWLSRLSEYVQSFVTLCMEKKSCFLVHATTLRVFFSICLWFFFQLVYVNVCKGVTRTTLILGIGILVS